jgi:uncharacterized protein (DUF433 family)
MGVHQAYNPRVPYPPVLPFERISVDSRIMAGVPCIAGTRIPVATVVAMVAEGMSPPEVVAEFSQLTADDVREALGFAAVAVDEGELPLRPAG